MDDLIEKHDQMPDCDCHNCALRERDRLRNALENLELQCVHSMVSGWVCIPEVEWSSIMMQPS